MATETPSSVKVTVPVAVLELEAAGERVAVTWKEVLMAGVVEAGVTTRVVPILPTLRVTVLELALL